MRFKQVGSVKGARLYVQSGKDPAVKGTAVSTAENKKKSDFI